MLEMSCQKGLLFLHLIQPGLNRKVALKQWKSWNKSGFISTPLLDQIFDQLETGVS